MPQIDLLVELQAAVARVRQPHLDRLQTLGVGGRTIAMMGHYFPPLGVVSAMETGNGLYEAGEGTECVVMPVHADGALVDLVAFRTDRPSRWLLRTGIGWALGSDQVCVPDWDNEPLPIWRTPLDWLIAAGTGLCILDWDAPELRDLLLVEAIEADRDIGRRLLDILSRPARLPRLVSRRAVRNAA